MTSSGASGSNLSLSSPNKPNHGRCLINVLTQKEWSLQVPFYIKYLDNGDYSSNNPREIIAKIFPVRWPHPLASAEKLPSYHLLNIQSEYINTGKYDRNLLYDTAQLISFPGMKVDSDGSAIIKLYGNKEEPIKMTIAIPKGFPDELLNKPVFLEVLVRTEHSVTEASMALCIIVIG
jgi:hypothetical protein